MDGQAPPSGTASTLQSTLEYLHDQANVWLDIAQRAPLTAPLVRYIKSSHQNDPFRTLLELLLFIFAIRTWRQSRTLGDAAKGFVKLSPREVDELVDEWQPESLISPSDGPRMVPSITYGQSGSNALMLIGPTADQLWFGRGAIEASRNLAIKHINLACQNFAGLVGEERIKKRAIEQLQRSGVGSCGPPGFYGTFDVHMELERDIAAFLGTQASIIYAQGFSTASSVIPAFSKRGDIIVADRGVNFAIQKGIQISRSTIRWYDHNSPGSLERVLEGLRRDDLQYRRRLTRRFIVTEGIFEGDGQMCNLPSIIRLKKKYKFRLILDETWSIGTIGRTGRGLAEHFSVPASDVDILIGSLATSFASAGGFCAGSKEVVMHQRINSAALVFSAALPPLLASAASESIAILTEPEGTSRMQAVRLRLARFREALRCSDRRHIYCPSDPVSPFLHLQLGDRFAGLDAVTQHETIHRISGRCLAQGVLVYPAQKVWTEEVCDNRPSLRVCLSAVMTTEDVDFAAQVIRVAMETET